MTKEIEKWDPILTERVTGMMRPVLKRYFRSEVHGLDNVPAGGALVVSNHSGGQMAVDVPIFADRLVREARVRPADLHAQPRHDHGRADREFSQADRVHPG